MTNAFGIEESGTVLRATGAKAVTVYRGMTFGGILVHALDHLVLTHILFAIASGEPLTPPILWKRLQSLGIRSSKNDDILVGRGSVYESFARIIAAGYIHRVQLPGENGSGFGPVVYLAYEDPADNPDHGTGTTSPETLARAQAQVAALAFAKSQVIPLTECQEAQRPDSATNGISAGQTAYRVPGSGELAPPHTPPEVKTLPSFPHTTPVPPVAAEAGPGGGGIRSATTKKPSRAEAAALKLAAFEFLRSLPGPWECGITVAKRTTNLLVQVHVDQGWPLGPELVAALTEEKRGARPIDSYPKTLAYRLGALPRYRPAAGGPDADQAAAGLLEPCQYHPKREASTCTICLAGPDYAAEQVLAVPAAPVEAEPVDETAGAEVPAAVRALFTKTARGAIPTSRDARSRQRTGRAAGYRKKLAMDAESDAADRAGKLAQLEELMRAEAAAEV